MHFLLVGELGIWWGLDEVAQHLADVEHGVGVGSAAVVPELAAGKAASEDDGAG